MNVFLCIWLVKGKFCSICKLTTKWPHWYYNSKLTKKKPISVLLAMFAFRIKSNSSGKLLKDHFNFSTLLYVVWTEIKNGEFVIFCIFLIDEEVCKKNTKLKCFIYRCLFYATKKGFNKQLTLPNIEVVNVEKNSVLQNKKLSLPIPWYCRIMPQSSVCFQWTNDLLLF